MGTVEQGMVREPPTLDISGGGGGGSFCLTIFCLCHEGDEKLCFVHLTQLRIG